MKSSSREDFFERSKLTLDLAGLTDEQRRNAQIFLGGSAAQYVNLGDNFEFNEVGTVVFRWGDDEAQNTFAQLFEHIETPSKHILPFVPVAIIDGQAWLTALQDKNFDPATAYRSDKHYVLLENDESKAQKQITAYFKCPPPLRQQLLGKIASRFALFELATSIGDCDAATVSEDHQPHIEDFLPEQNEMSTSDELIGMLRSLTEAWDFEGKSSHENYTFVLNVCYAMLEHCGRIQHEGESYIYSSFDQHAEAEKIPPSLKPLISYVWKDNVYYHDENFIMLKTNSEYIEHDPVIPRWGEIEQIKTFEDRLAFMAINPDIVSGMVATSHEFMPQVSLFFEPDRRYHKWGLEFIVNPFSIRVVPYGDRGETPNIMQFATELQKDETKLQKTVLQLALCGAESDGQIKHVKLDPAAMPAVFEQVTKDKTPQRDISESPKMKHSPENAVKNLLISSLKQMGLQ